MGTRHFFCSFLLLWSSIAVVTCQLGSKVNTVEEYADHKDFKHLLRTRTNVMVLFVSSVSRAVSFLKIYREAAKEVRGIGTMVMVDCGGDGKKLCRILKASPDTYVLHHYKDGKFNRVYDRKETVKSLVRFMNDPTGDVPWEEEPSGKTVVHLPDIPSLEKLINKNKAVMVMFYAPWCVYCKQMKPEYAAAATIVKQKGYGILAAMDAVRPENAAVRMKFEINGFPTLHYFKNGEVRYTYNGDNKQDKLVEFMMDPTASVSKAKELEWSETSTDVVQLTESTFDSTLQSENSMLVMFYAPWCGHCKNMKPEYEKAAAVMKKEKIPGILAAVDVTKETTLAEKYSVRGFPTIKYFRNGAFAFDAPQLREQSKLVEFMHHPKEPPSAPPPEPAWVDIPSEVVHLNEDTFKPQLRSKRHALVMFYAPWCGHCKQAKPEFMAAAEKLKDELRIVFGAVDCTQHQALCSSHDVKGYPTFKYFMYYNKGGKDYTGGRKAYDFVEFMKTLEEPLSSPNTIVESSVETEPSVTPEEKVASSTESWSSFSGGNNVINVTDSSFDSLLSQHSSLLILFYATWCKHCRDIKPIFAEAAGTMPTEYGALGACDITEAQDLADKLQIQALPTIKYFRSGVFVADYSGSRTPSALIDFVKRHQGGRKEEL